MKVKSESEVAQSCPTLATPWTAAYQAPPSIGFSRQKYWSVVPLPSPKVAQLCPTLSDPVDCSLTGSSVHGIFQARVLEWGTIAFSVVTPWTAAYQAPPSIGFSRQEYWNGVPSEYKTTLKKSIFLKMPDG